MVLILPCSISTIKSAWRRYLQKLTRLFKANQSYVKSSPQNNFYKSLKNSNLHYTRGITPKRVTSGGAHLRSLALDNTATMKRRSGGKPSATAMSLTTRVRPVFINNYQNVKQ